MRIYTDLSSHDSAAPVGHKGGRIVRTDSTPEVGEPVIINGKFVFPVPEGAALTVDGDSFYFPQEDADSIPSRTAAEFLIRYPMYDHIVYNFYLDNADVTSFDVGAPSNPLPDPTNTTPPFPSNNISGPLPRCQIGNPAGTGMCPQSLAMLGANFNASQNYYGCIVTAMIDLWYFNPCYIEVDDPVTLSNGDIILIDGIPLEAVSPGPAGVDEFLIDAASAVNTALNLSNAINDAANSFSTLVSATIDPTVPTRVQLRPIPPTNTAVTVVQAAVFTGLTIVESHPGTDEVMMWWETTRQVTSFDQGPDQTGYSPPNTPAYKYLQQTSEEDPSLLVYASVDDGVSWYRVPYLEPIDLVNAGTQLRVAFINLDGGKLYLSGFCVLFPDLLAPL